MLFLLFLLSIIIIFVSIDVYVAIEEWQSRIHIGRWDDRKKWQQAVEGKAQKWLNHAPTVRKTSQNRLILIDIIRGEYRNSTIQKWQDAGLLLGLDKASAEKYVAKNKTLFEHQEFVPEDLLLAYSLKKCTLLSERQEEKILACFQEFRTTGTVYYRPWVQHLRFVDTLGMILPFFFLCGWDDLAKRQLEEYDVALLDHVYPAHAYDLEKNLPLGVFDWARGIGWYVLALIEVPNLSEHGIRILNLADSLLKHQNKDGSFSCFVFNQHERIESSGTALIGLLFVAAYKVSKAKKFLYAARKAEKALMKATRRNGALDYCQGDTYGIGYYSQVFSVMPFAQGMTLRLSKQLDEFVNEDTELC